MKQLGIKSPRQKQKCPNRKANKEIAKEESKKQDLLKNSLIARNFNDY